MASEIPNALPIMTRCTSVEVW